MITGLRNSYGQRQLGIRAGESKSVDTRIAGSVRILGRDVDAIFRRFPRDTSATYPFRENGKTASFPSPLTIDAPVFADQPEPEASLAEGSRRTLEASARGAIMEKRKEVVAREQEAAKKEDKGSGERTPEANDVCTSETCGEEKIKGETCLEKSMRREPSNEQQISPTKLSELINSSIKEAVQSIVKQCSMEERKLAPPRSEEESEKKSRVCRSRVTKERRKKSLDACNNRQRACHVSRRCNNLLTCSDSHPCAETHEAAIPVESKINNDQKKIKKHSKPASNVNTDNRRMTGNVNIYICSEANNNRRMNGKEKLEARSCTETSSDVTTEQSNSRCVTASSASSCKLLDNIREKRKKLRAARQTANSVQDEADSISSGNDGSAVIRDNRRASPRRRLCGTESSESADERTDAKVLVDEGTECKADRAAPSTSDDRCCEDAALSGADLPSGSMIPCPSLSARDVPELSPSWATTRPSTTARLDDSDVLSLPNAFCTDAKRRNYRENGNDRGDDVCGNDDGEYTVCDAIRDNGWLPKSIYTNRFVYGRRGAERFVVDEGGCRNRPRDTALRCNDIRKKQVGCKLMRRSLENCRREHVARQWSCSCIAEEEEEEEEERQDCCANVDGAERKLSANLCNNAKGLKKVSICRTPRSELAETATACETVSLGDAGKHFEKIRTRDGLFGKLAECRRSAAARETTLEDSKEAAKGATGVRTEFVAEAPPRDITVCRTMFVEPKAPPEGAAVCETAAPPDRGEVPEETICKILDSNHAGRGDVEGVSLNDAKDKLAKERADSANLNNREGNAARAEGVEAVQSDGTYNSVASDNFTGRNSAKGAKRDERTERSIANNLASKIPVVPVGSISDPASLSENIYSTTSPRMGSHDRSSATSNHNAREISKIVDQRKTIKRQLPPPYRPMRRRFQHFSKASRNSTTRDTVLSEESQAEEKIREKSKEEDEKKGILKEAGKAGVKPRDTFLYRKLINLIDAIRRGKPQSKDKAETTKEEAVSTFTNDEKGVTKSKSVAETEDKINDEKEHRDTGEKMDVAVESALASKQETIRNAVDVERSRAIAPDFAVSEENKKTDISSVNQATRLRPKLLRIIREKRLRHFRPIEVPDGFKSREAEVESVPIEISINGRTDEEKIPQESIPTEIAEEAKAEEPIAPKVSITEVKDISKEVVEIPKEAVEIAEVVVHTPKDVADEHRPSKDVDETTNVYVPCSRKKSEEESRRLASCRCGALPGPNDHSRVITICAKCKSALEDCLCEANVCNGLRRREDRCAHCRLSTTECACAPMRYPNSCRLKTVKPKSCSVPPSRNSAYVCARCCRTGEECECEKTVVSSRCCRPREECRGWTVCANCPRMFDKCRCRSLANHIDCCRPGDKCRHAASTFVDCHKRDCSRKKAMICLYCDNPRDECTCRAPIGKCSYCGLPLDVCSCQDDEDRDRNREQIIRKPNEDRSIRVTGWRPRREIRRYFARDLEDLQSDTSEEHHCRDEPRRRGPEELSYQRLNVFSNVMNELQRKMSESVCCARCGRNPCCCGSQVEVPEEKERERKGRRLDVEKPRSKPPNNCRRCNANPRVERKNIVQKRSTLPMSVCKLWPCRCRKSRTVHKGPLTKCYYCKSLPCTCIVAR